MESGGREHLEGEEELGTSGKDTGVGGRYPAGIGDVIQGGGAGGTPIRIGDGGDETLNRQVHGHFSAQIFQEDYRETAEATGVGWGVGSTHCWIKKRIRPGLRRWDHMS